MTIVIIIKILSLKKSSLQIFAKNFKNTIYVLQYNLKDVCKKRRNWPFFINKDASFISPDSVGVKKSQYYWEKRSLTVYFHIEKAVYGLTVEEDVKNETFSIERLLTAIKETHEFDLLLGKVKPKCFFSNKFYRFRYSRHFFKFLKILSSAKVVRPIIQ